MRKAIFILAALLTMSATLPVFAEMTGSDKNECLLTSRNCSNAVDDIQTKMKRISNEVAKGTAVYTPQELKKLEQKLADIRTLLDEMQARQ